MKLCEINYDMIVPATHFAPQLSPGFDIIHNKSKLEMPVEGYPFPGIYERFNEATLGI